MNLVHGSKIYRFGQQWVQKGRKESFIVLDSWKTDQVRIIKGTIYVLLFFFFFKDCLVWASGRFTEVIKVE